MRVGGRGLKGQQQPEATRKRGRVRGEGRGKLISNLNQIWKALEPAEAEIVIFSQNTLSIPPLVPLLQVLLIYYTVSVGSISPFALLFFTSQVPPFCELLHTLHYSLLVCAAIYLHVKLLTSANTLEPQSSPLLLWYLNSPRGASD